MTGVVARRPPGLSVVINHFSVVKTIFMSLNSQTKSLFKMTGPLISNDCKFIVNLKSLIDHLVDENYGVTPCTQG
jgi:hypothetical protein